MEWITKYTFRTEVFDNAREAIATTLEKCQQWSTETGIKIEFLDKVKIRDGRKVSIAENILVVYASNKTYYYKIHSHSLGTLELKSGSNRDGRFAQDIPDERFRKYLCQLTPVNISKILEKIS